MKTIELFFIVTFMCLTTHADESGKKLTLASNEKLVEQYVAEFVMDEVLKSIDIDMIVQHLPPARAKQHNLDKVTDGELARITPYGNDKPSLKQIAPAHYYLESAAYCTKGRKINITKRDELLGYKLVSIKGVAHSDAATVGAKYVTQLNSAVQAFDFLKAGRADIVIDTEINGRRLLLKNDYRSYIELCGVFKRFDLFMYLNTNKASLIPSISKRLNALKQSGELSRLVKEAERKALSLSDSHF